MPAIPTAGHASRPSLTREVTHAASDRASPAVALGPNRRRPYVARATTPRVPTRATRGCAVISEIPIVPVARLTRREEHFRCEPLGAVLSVAACGRRQEIANEHGGRLRDWRNKEHRARYAWYETCSNCETGKGIAKRVKRDRSTTSPVRAAATRVKPGGPNRSDPTALAIEQRALAAKYDALTAEALERKLAPAPVSSTETSALRDAIETAVRRWHLSAPQRAIIEEACAGKSSTQIVQEASAPRDTMCSRIRALLRKTGARSLCTLSRDVLREALAISSTQATGGAR